MTLGNLSLGEPGFPLKQAVMDALFKLKEEKAMELQFSVGEAMACTLAGGFCTLARDPWRLPSTATRWVVKVDTGLRVGTGCKVGTGGGY